MNINFERYVLKRPPIYVIASIQVLCTSLSLIVLNYWRKIPYPIIRYATLFSLNFAVCALVNHFYELQLIFPLVLRLAIGMTLIFGLSEQLEMSIFRKNENIRLAQEKQN